MFKSICKSLIFNVLMAVVFVLVSSGCGRKAPPVAPRREKPPVVDESNVKKQPQDEKRQIQAD